MIPKFNWSFEFFKSIYVFIFAWYLIAKMTFFKTSLHKKIAHNWWASFSLETNHF